MSTAQGHRSERFAARLGSLCEIPLHQKLAIPARALVLASGTPITNTLGEMFSIQRLLGHDALAERGLHGSTPGQAASAAVNRAGDPARLTSPGCPARNSCGRRQMSGVTGSKHLAEHVRRSRGEPWPGFRPRRVRFESALKPVDIFVANDRLTKFRRLINDDLVGLVSSLRQFQTATIPPSIVPTLA